MQLAWIWCCLFGMMLVAGCNRPAHPTADGPGRPNYVARWNELRVGMSRGEVRKLLGAPVSVLRYTEDAARVPRAREFGDDKAALQADIEAIFGEPHVWQYGRFALAGVSDEAYVVYFDAMGHVARWRRPVRGPLSDGTRPAESPEGAETLEQIRSPAELWNTPTLTPRK